jgi:hypothetical protein
MACVLCSSVHNPTDEDVIPKWLLRAFKVEDGPTIVSVREEHDAKRDVTTLKRFHYAGRRLRGLSGVHC